MIRLRYCRWRGCAGQEAEGSQTVGEKAEGRLGVPDFAPAELPQAGRELKNSPFENGGQGGFQQIIKIMKKNSKKINRDSGFTLVEIIASLVIFGLMLTLAGMGIVMAAKGYVITKESTHMAQKAQLAMARINRELMEITAVAARFDTQPNPYIIYDHLDGRKAIAKDGSVIKMFFNLGTQTTLPSSGGDILVDDITQFTLTYYKSDSNPWVLGTHDIKELSSIGVEIVMSRKDSEISDKTFETAVRPRNTGR